MRKFVFEKVFSLTFRLVQICLQLFHSTKKNSLSSHISQKEMYHLVKTLKLTV